MVQIRSMCKPTLDLSHRPKSSKIVGGAARGLLQLKRTRTMRLDETKELTQSTFGSEMPREFLKTDDNIYCLQKPVVTKRVKSANKLSAKKLRSRNFGHDSIKTTVVWREPYETTIPTQQSVPKIFPQSTISLESMGIRNH